MWIGHILPPQDRRPLSHSLFPSFQMRELVYFYPRPHRDGNPPPVCNIGDGAFISYKVLRLG